jgi:hypothetical protein
MDSIWLLLHEGHSVIMLFVLQLLDCDAHQKHASQSKKFILSPNSFFLEGVSGLIFGERKSLD